MNESAASAPARKKPFRWGLLSSAAIVLALVVVGQGVGALIDPYFRFAKAAWVQEGIGGVFTWPADWVDEHGFQAKEGLFLAFLASSIAWLWVQRGAVKRFFRSMSTGVALVTFTTVAVGLGVLVPQIEGFEDPDARVDLEHEHEKYLAYEEYGYLPEPHASDGENQYKAFRWAEGFFFYHLAHFYGIGMPEGTVPPFAEEGLESFAHKYGHEEAKNRRKAMEGAFASRDKSAEIGAFIREHEGAFWTAFEWCTYLDLNRAYKSYWFATLLTLLGTAVTLNTFKGSFARNLSIHKLGFFVVHMGVLTLLFGGLVSKMLTDRGILHLDLEAPPRNTYWRHYDPEKLAQLPFHVGLDHFARHDWKALEVHFHDEDFSSRPPRYTLWESREIDLDQVETETGEWRPRLRIEIVELSDRAAIGEPRLEEVGPSRDGYPVAVLRVHDPSHAHHDHGDGGLDPDHTTPVYLAPFAESAFYDPGREARIVARVGTDPRDAFPPEEGVLGLLEVDIAGTGMAEPAVVPVRLRSTEVVEGWEITFRRATTNFRLEGDAEQRSEVVDTRPLAEQPVREPMVEVRIVPPDGRAPETRIVLQSLDASETELQDQFPFPEVETRLWWDRWAAPGPPRWVLAWGDGPPVLHGENGERMPVEEGEALPLELSEPILLERVYGRAAFSKDLTLLPPREQPDGWDRDFYSSDPRGVRLRVTHEPGTPQEEVEEVVMASTDRYSSRLWHSGDGRFSLLFLENTEGFPFEWRSVLSIHERGEDGALREVDIGPESEREIRVNDYLHYGGYRFFQTNAIPELPTYSGIGVVYDPGIPVVLTGMYTIIAGAVIAFLVRPVVLLRRRRAKEATT